MTFLSRTPMMPQAGRESAVRRFHTAAVMVVEERPKSQTKLTTATTMSAKDTRSIWVVILATWIRVGQRAGSSALQQRQYTRWFHTLQRSKLTL